ncbi:hypothetical protein C1H46_040707 [Malus baccata]|uniref:protoporphyrinogen oxidase n=1 Tax=Malus baccata TaxID=106549 RepID=A0A540KHW8_MALBA|nr:hypothetical protein C1H46_040707 [Malus baccata]
MSSPTKQDQQSSVKRVAVVGAGVSGLAAAYKLKSHGFDVAVFEAEGRAGGKLRSVSRDGLIWDEGANTMTESETEVQTLLDNLGLREKQQFPISQTKRYIVRNGMPVLLPTNPIALITSNFLSAQSKLLIILEPFLWKKKGVSDDDTQESVGGFFQRHFGPEVVDYLIDPFVAGTSGGDPESLSMRHSFPDLWNMEKRFGSVISGAIKSKLSAKKEKSGQTKGSVEKGKHQRGSFSFHGGMQTLTDTLCNELGKDELKLNSTVLSLSYSHDGKSAFENWSVSSAAKDDKHSQSLSVDAVVMTAPLCNVKEMNITKRGTLFPLDFFPEVTYIPLSVIITTFKKEDVKRPLEGFGVLVPSKEQKNGLKTLGTLFSSMMFPDRAPSDLHLYTTFVGGSRNKELAKASTGLAAAYKLKSHGFDVAVFEAEGRAGGKLRSVSRDDLIWDEGANLMTESETEVQTLLDNLGLREKQQFPISQTKRYIVRNGTPVLLPTNPIALIKSNFLSAQSKTLTDTLCNQLGKDELKLNSKVLSLSYSHDGKSAFENWSVSSATKDDKHSQSLSVDGVVMTAPLCNVKEMNITKRGTLFPLDFFPEVTYVPVSVIITTFKKEDVKRPLEGFGVLVPSKEQKNGLKILGNAWHGPIVHQVTCIFILPLDELKKIVTSDIRHWLGAEGEPTSVNHYHWSKACPLYGHNYDSVIEAIEKMEKNLPGFFYAGNHRGGLSVDNAIASGCKAAELVIAYLESPPDEKTRQE